MTKVKMLALDTVHVTSVQSEPLLADAEFETSEEEANQLEAAGLAKRVTAKAAPAKVPAKSKGA